MEQNFPWASSNQQDQAQRQKEDKKHLTHSGWKRSSNLYKLEGEKSLSKVHPNLKCGPLRRKLYVSHISLKDLPQFLFYWLSF